MEEYIEILEDIVQEVFEFVNNGYEMNRREVTALENLIKGYRELEERHNKYMNGELFSAKQLKEIEKTRDEYYVHKLKIKEKIEELNKEEQELQESISEEEREEYSDANISYALMDIEVRRRVLQELLEA